MENKNYLELRRKEQPSWIYPALSREAWEGYSHRMERGLLENACHDGFIEAIMWYYDIPREEGVTVCIDTEPGASIDMLEYTDGHVKAPQAIINLFLRDSANGELLGIRSLEMTWLDYCIVSRRYIKWVAERWAI